MAIDQTQAERVDASGQYIVVRRLNPNGKRCGLIDKELVDGINYELWFKPATKPTLLLESIQHDRDVVSTFNLMTAEVE